jgi:phenylalanyl-tRNA synthetase beta chain
VPLFEVGPVYAALGDAGQAMMAAGVRSAFAHAHAPDRHWQSHGAPVDAFDVKADTLSLLAELGAPVENLAIANDAPSWYHPGRAGVLRLGPKTVLAQFGEIHPQILADMDVKGPLAGFEIFLDNLPAAKRKPQRTKPVLQLSDFMPLERDFAFVVDADLPAESLIRTARGVDKQLISDVTLFDVFEGKGVERGKKSLAIAVTITPREKTLTEVEIDALSQKIIAAVGKATGGVLRS